MNFAGVRRESQESYVHNLERIGTVPLDWILNLEVELVRDARVDEAPALNWHSEKCGSGLHLACPSRSQRALLFEFQLPIHNAMIEMIDIYLKCPYVYVIVNSG